MKPTKSPYDDRQRYCPRLGHPVHFDYCRIGGDNQCPCFKVFDCWWEQFDVVGYFKQQLTAAEFKRVAGAPLPNKTTSLIDLIKQAKQRTQNKE
jgi:hypothetical protein